MDTCPNAAETLERLTPKLQAIAWRVADNGYDPEDAFQDMTLTLLEHGKADPIFLEQTDAYILTMCVWRSRNKAQMGRDYGRHVESESEDEDSEFETVIDQLPQPENTVEKNEFMAGLMEVINSLAPKDRQIISLLAIECTPAEISRQLNVSRSAVCQRLQRLRNKLALYAPA